VSDDALAWFNRLSGRLRIALTEPAAPASARILNLVAPPTARLASVELQMEVYERDRDDLAPVDRFRPLTDDEWARVVLRVPFIKLRGESELVVEHAAPDGHAFTTRDLSRAIEEAERQGRGASEWLGGIDVHHTFFEGIRLGSDGVWSIDWGS
jgi:hypothetical protein